MLADTRRTIETCVNGKTITHAAAIPVGPQRLPIARQTGRRMSCQTPNHMRYRVCPRTVSTRDSNGLAALIAA